MNELTHASFFSGVGGTDLGLERAGFRTVSFSEVDPYACAVLAERWPGVPNHGDIVGLGLDAKRRSADGGSQSEPASREWHRAFLWTGGFPCQDLSVAGKRRGFTGERSVLAFAFLALVERHRPPAILLENVPGLLSSNGGRDMARLIGEMVELGYGVAYRVLDAQHFGVPQRRRRVFILGLRSDPDDADGRVAAERAAEVLSVGARCPRHPATGHETGQGAADGAEPGVDFARAVTGTRKRHDEDTDTLIAGSVRAGGHGDPGIGRDGDERRLVLGTLREHVRPGSNSDFSVLSAPPDADRVREADGLAGRPHDREQLAFVKSARPTERDGEESWIEGRVMPTLNSFDVGDVRTTAAIVQGGFLDVGYCALCGTPSSRSDDECLSQDWTEEGYSTAVTGEHVWNEPILSPTLLAPGTEGGRRDKIPQVVQSLDTKRGGPDDNEAQAGHLVAELCEGGCGGPEPHQPHDRTFVMPLDDPLLPLGLDSHRYRCCGNGVVAPVAEWIGHRIVAFDEAR